MVLLLLVNLAYFWFPGYAYVISKNHIPAEKRSDAYTKLTNRLKNNELEFDRKNLIKLIENIESLENSSEELLKSTKNSYIKLAFVIFTILLLHFLALYKYINKKNPNKTNAHGKI